MFSYTAQVHTIPIVITLVTKSGASEELKDGVQHQMAMLGRQLSVNISVAEVDRFGKTYFNLCLIFCVYKMAVLLTKLSYHHILTIKILNLFSSGLKLILEEKL